MAAVTDWMSLAEPDKEWVEFVKTQFGGVCPNVGMFPDIFALRSWAEQQDVAGEVDRSQWQDVKESDHQVKTRDGGSIVCRVYQPEMPIAGGGPLVVLLHGGGWCIGGLANEDPLCRALTRKLRTTCVNVDYRLAPEHKFPIPVHDCHDAVKWAATNATLIGADPSKGFILGGSSAGGSMTGAIAHLLRDERFTPPLTGCLYKIPAFLDSGHVPDDLKNDFKSYYQLQDADILGKAAMELFLNNYMDKPADRGDPLHSSMLWPTGHAGLPPSVFQICGADPLRDEALIFERKLRQDQGIPTRLLLYPGVPHGFWGIAQTLEVSKRFVRESIEGVEWLLEQHQAKH